MDFLLEALTNWLKEMLVGGIMGNLSGMFDSVNQQVGDISVQVGQTPQGWNGGIFSMIQNLSNSIMVPIAGVILAIVMTLELIQMITDKNNLHDVDIHRRVHTASVYFGSALRESLHHFLLMFGRLRHDVVVFHLRGGQVQLVGSLDVRHFFEQVHQLRQVEKLGESGARPIAGSLGNEFVKMIFVSFLNSNIYPLKNLPTSRVCIFLETPYSKASSHFPIASHLQ